VRLPLSCRHHPRRPRSSRRRPWRRLRAVIEQKVVDMHTHAREFDDSGLTKEDRDGSRGCQTVRTEGR
jgi:hypothetical protein